MAYCGGTDLCVPCEGLFEVGTNLLRTGLELHSPMISTFSSFFKTKVITLIRSYISNLIIIH